MLAVQFAVRTDIYKEYRFKILLEYSPNISGNIYTSLPFICAMQGMISQYRVKWVIQQKTYSVFEFPLGRSCLFCELFPELF
jgi:hypothetical protein